MPPRAPVFHIAASQDCAVAQRLQLALSLRGVVPEVTALRPNNGVSGLTRLSYRGAGRGNLILYDSLAMLELVEDLFPDQPLHPADPALRAHHREMIGRILVAHQGLAAVMAARDPRGLDLAIYRLRDQLRPIDEQLEPPRPKGPLVLSNLSIAMAPLLWRLRVIDGGFLAGLGAGLLRLRACADQLLADPAVTAVLDDAAASRFVARIKDSGSALTSTDLSSVWDRAFASAKPENTPS